MDQGIGMDEEQTARCLDGSHKRFTAIEGSGSGLSAVNAALKKVEGSIKVDSIKGIGTSFKLTVPLSVLNKLTKSEDYSKLSVLVADDGVINRKLTVKLLRKLGVPLKSIFAVETKEQAFRAFTTQYDLGRPINLILTDLNMGRGTDGFELAAEVRRFEEEKRFASRTHLLIVSATVCTTDKGFEFTDGQLLKPLSKEDLALHLSKAKNPPPLSSKSYFSEASTPAVGVGSF